MEDLERYDAIVLAVLREIHRRHTPSSKLTINGVRIRESRSQPFDGEGQILDSWWKIVSAQT
jgi:hypothetical protein